MDIKKGDEHKMNHIDKSTKIGNLMLNKDKRRVREC